MKSSAVQVRDGRGEYTPTEQEWRDNQLRLLRDAMRATIRDDRVAMIAAGEVPILTLRQEFERAAYTALFDRAFNSEKDSDRIAAAAATLKAANEQKRLDADLYEQSEPRATKVVVVNSADIQRLGEMQRMAAKP